MRVWTWRKRRPWIKHGRVGSAVSFTEIAPAAWFRWVSTGSFIMRIAYRGSIEPHISTIHLVTATGSIENITGLGGGASQDRPIELHFDYDGRGRSSGLHYEASSDDDAVATTEALESNGEFIVRVTGGRGSARRLRNTDLHRDCVLASAI